MENTAHNTLDITSKIDEALRISEVAFETRDAIMVTDSDANIVRVNQSFLDTTGYNANEVIGMNVRMMNSGRHDKAFYVRMWQQLLSTGSWTGEIFDKRKCGDVYPKWMKITAVKNAK
jgi:PAS domain S-box-containing protein